jgi:RNA polymerase sigma-70 factor (ECF subfamily)
MAVIDTTEAGEPLAVSGSDDDRILSSIRRGDRRAAEELVERTYQMVFASLARLCGGDGDLASDLTQETYRKAWESIGRFEGRSKLSTWLYRIAYTTFLNHVRTPRRVVALDDAPPLQLVDPSVGVDDAIGSAEEHEQLRAAVTKLPEDLQFTVTAHFWAGLSVKEIATIEKVTTVAIRKRLNRAFTALETALRKGPS